MPNRQQRNTTTSKCSVCNAEARIINYGALSCYSCKTFFRRHIYYLKDMPPCHNGGHCEMSISMRKFCSPCRLTKCLAVGMASDLIRKKYQRPKSRALAQSNTKSLIIGSMNTLNLLCNDQSSLTNADWTLLSNVLHAFDKFSLVEGMRDMIKYWNCPGKSLQFNAPDIFGLLASFHTAVQSFISVTADFRVLTSAEQSSLLQRNLNGVSGLYSSLIFRDAGVFDVSGIKCFMEPFYEHETVNQGKIISMRIDSNSILVKIMNLICAFSTNCNTITYDPHMASDPLLMGTFRLLGSQNVYAELLWNYMLYKYGYYETVLRFATLVKHVLDLIAFSADLHFCHRQHQVIMDELVEEAKTKLILSETDVTPLWGKTIDLTQEQNNNK